MQPEKITEVKVWFQKASNDLRGADIDFAASPPFIEDVLFHCQQAAEKAMKGFLTAHDKVFRKTHDLDALAIVCETIDPTLADARPGVCQCVAFSRHSREGGNPEAPEKPEFPPSRE